jgi:hypothetical protein
MRTDACRLAVGVLGALCLGLAGGQAQAAEIAPAGAPEPSPAPAAGAPGPSPGIEPGSTKRGAPQWWYGFFDPGPTQNCVHGYFEPLGNTWNGWYGDLGTSPTTDDVYYVTAGWAVSGFPCGGGAYVHAELVLPANTRLAISNQNPVECWFDPASGDRRRITDGSCPQNPQAGTYGGYSFDPVGEAAWPTASGSIIDIYVPVKTSRPMGGPAPSDGTPCENCLYAGIWMIDGVNSPWAWPKVPIAVAAGSNPSTGPYVNYQAPPAVPFNPSTGPPPSQFTYVGDKIHAYIRGFLYTEGTSGTAWFEVGPRPGNYPNQGDPVAVPNGDWLVYDDGQTAGAPNFSFTPGKTYHFRLCYRRADNNNKVCGPDQGFHAPPDTGISGVEVKRRRERATVYFDAPPESAVASFQCSLDGGQFKPCTSPRVFNNLSKGSHDVRVRSVDAQGGRDGSPARADFKI